MKQASILFCVVVLASIHPAAGQTKPDTSRPEGESELERLLEELTQDTEDSELVELLTDLLNNPLDLNSATAEELRQLPGITSILAFRIIQYRSEKGFADVSNLLDIEGMSWELFQRIRPFVRVQPLLTPKPSVRFGALHYRTRSSRDLQTRRGFAEGTYVGSPWKIYHRLIARSNDLSALLGFEPARLVRHESFVEIGLVVEKDAGERSWNDFTAGYLRFQSPPLGSRLILGDYVVEAGEGLVYWRATWLGKGSEVISSVQKGGGGIRPYASTDENSFFRGIAAETRLFGLTLTALYSSKSLHASVDEAGRITSLNSSGLFRTERELRTKNASREKMFGFLITSYPLPGAKIGLAFTRSTFDHPAWFSGDFGLRGTEAGAYGINLAYTRSTVGAAMEVARSLQGSVAGIGSVVFRPARGLDVAIHGRYYPERFVSLHAFAFGESGGPPTNESGLYFGFRVRPLSSLTVSAYADHFRFPWRTFRTGFPSSGHDLLTILDMRLTEKLFASLQYKQKKKGTGESIPTITGGLQRRSGFRSQHNYRASFELNSSITFRWRSRFEWVNVGYAASGVRERGFLAYQDVRLYPALKWLLHARAIVFHTDSFDSRLYEFETDVPGSFSNPALFGRGLRWYVATRYEVTDFLDLWMKYSITVKEGVKFISSGANEIRGDVDNRLTLQLDIQLQ
jgi:hypothetical protein